jgi:hypothetical protein
MVSISVEKPAAPEQLAAPTQHAKVGVSNKQEREGGEPAEGPSRLSWWADVSARGTAFAVAPV